MREAMKRMEELEKKRREEEAKRQEEERIRLEEERFALCSYHFFTYFYCFQFSMIITGAIKHSYFSFQNLEVTQRDNFTTVSVCMR